MDDRHLRLFEKIENIHLFGIERILETGGDIGNFGKIDREQEYVGDIDLPDPPQDMRARDHEAAFAHLLAVDESGGVTGDEDEYFSGVAEAVIADCAPSDHVRGNMVEEDQPERDPAKQVEPQIAAGGDHRGVYFGRSFGRGRMHLNLVGLRPAWEWPRRDGCGQGA